VRPKCLLLDEPLSNLDAKLRLEMRGEIRRICKKFGLTAVYVTHDQKEALSIADRIAVLDKGKIQQCGSPRDVYKMPASRFVANFIGETNFIDATVAAIGEDITLETPIGRIISSTHPASPLSVGATVTLSIRPEVLHVGYDSPADAGNVFNAAIHDTIYLGEMAQHEINILSSAGASEQKLVAYDMNPKIVALDQNQHIAKIWFRKNNVVILTH